MKTKKWYFKKDLKDFYANIKRIKSRCYWTMCIPPIDANPEDVFK